MKKHISFIFILFLLLSCSNDKGNYNYEELNTITISDVKASYTFILDEFIDINPTIAQTVSTSELEYTWEINNENISTERHLNILMPDGYPAGEKQGRFIVYDKNTGLSTYQLFKIILVSPFNFGYYFLTENANKESVLSYYASSNVVDDKYGPGEIKHTTAIDGFSLGKEPTFIKGSFGRIASTGSYNWTIYLGSKDNRYPCIETNNANFKVTTLISADNFIEKGQYDFAPDEMIISMRSIVTFASQGSPVEYGKGYLYRPGIYSKNYSWSNLMMHGNGNPFYTAFDNVSEKFYVLTNNTDPYALDKVVDVIGSPNLTGKRILGSNCKRYSSEKFAIAANESEFNFIKFLITTTEKKVESNDVIYTDIFTENSKAVLIAENDWFISSKNILYTTPTLMPTISVFATIPEECGEIIAFGPSARNSTIILATYNENSTEKYKGSIIFIDKYSKEMTIFKNVIHKCIDLLGGNASTNNTGYGDDK